MRNKGAQLLIGAICFAVAAGLLYNMAKVEQVKHVGDFTIDFTINKSGISHAWAYIPLDYSDLVLIDMLPLLNSSLITGETELELEQFFEPLGRGRLIGVKEALSSLPRPSKPQRLSHYELVYAFIDSIAQPIYRFHGDDGFVVEVNAIDWQNY